VLYAGGAVAGNNVGVFFFRLSFPCGFSLLFFLFCSLSGVLCLVFFARVLCPWDLCAVFICPCGLGLDVGLGLWPVSMVFLVFGYSACEPCCVLLSNCVVAGSCPFCLVVKFYFFVAPAPEK
jgi:hypothetical protein